MTEPLSPARQELLTLLTDPKLWGHISILFTPFPTATAAIQSIIFSHDAIHTLTTNRNSMLQTLTTLEEFHIARRYLRDYFAQRPTRNNPPTPAPPPSTSPSPSPSPPAPAPQPTTPGEQATRPRTRRQRRRDHQNQVATVTILPLSHADRQLHRHWPAAWQVSVCVCDHCGADHFSYDCYNYVCDGCNSCAPGHTLCCCPQVYEHTVGFLDPEGVRKTLKLNFLFFFIYFYPREPKRGS